MIGDSVMALGVLRTALLWHCPPVQHVGSAGVLLGRVDTLITLILGLEPIAKEVLGLGRPLTLSSSVYRGGGLRPLRQPAELANHVQIVNWL